MTTEPTHAPAGTLEHERDGHGGAATSDQLRSGLATDASTPATGFAARASDSPAAAGDLVMNDRARSSRSTTGSEVAADLPSGVAGEDELPSTGVAEVDAALSRLAELRALPVEQHPDRFDRVAADLHAVLADAATAGDGR